MNLVLVAILAYTAGVYRKQIWNYVVDMIAKAKKALADRKENRTK